ncbi:hypothetical protein [Bacillus sp. OTU530]|uniref:hypothetical protein n=1 Tax=Bacillus sp. OTU530 TaxID=3043862 RepID=UPI00313B398B
MKLVRIALWIVCILSTLLVVLFVPLRNYFNIDLGLGMVVSMFSCDIFVLLLTLAWKPQKTGGSPSNSQKTT